MPAAGRQPERQRQKLASRGLAGWVRWRGTPSTHPWSAPPSTVVRDLLERGRIPLLRNGF
ncbi:hypothetical protein C1924_02650 [Stenotrophomonas sp. ESTM1D_MKCIP4_1]|nr:hypothetical protein C1924_02650 [Stenotrophomonas sp. ESTM1D_MKCIP4_1]